MFKQLMKKLGRYRLILDRTDQEPYLERYYIFLKDRKRFPFNVFLHKFLKSDPDNLHDHPWPYFTLILWGGYWEWVPAPEHGEHAQLKKWRGPGHFRFCNATSFHRIEVEQGVTAWTLFVPGPQKREWGFQVGDDWVGHDQYFVNKRKMAK
jgi:hypothetical protein